MVSKRLEIRGRWMRKALFSIRTQLIGVFLIPVVLIALLSTMSYSKSAAGMIRNYENSVLSNMSNMVKYLEFGFDSVEAKATLVNSNKNLREYYSGNYKLDEVMELAKFREVQELINANVLSESYINSILLFAGYGTGISSNGTVSKDMYQKFFESEDSAGFKKNGLRAVWVGRHSYLDDEISYLDESRYGMSYMRYILNSSGKEVGVIVLDIPIKYIKNVLEGSGFPEGSITAFVTGDGREILSGDYPEAFRFWDQAYYAETKGMEGEGLRYVTHNGREYLYVYSKVQHGDSVLCTLIPKSAIVHEAEAVKRFTWLIVIVTSVIAIISCSVIASAIGNTIRKINTTLNRAAEGDLRGEVHIKRRDEFQVLGKGINHMISGMLSIIQRMKEISQDVAGAALSVAESTGVLQEATKSISETVKHIESGVVQQAADTESCLVEMEELAEKISIVYENAEKIEKEIAGTRMAVQRGFGMLNVLDLKTKRTISISRGMTADVQNLEKESDAIMGIIGIISRIAEQTNLLALNASIEAARAGQAGRGFAVVADEIRKLAEESKKSVESIDKIIGNIKKQMHQTIETAVEEELTLSEQETALKNTVHAFMEIDQNMETFSIYLNTIVEDIGCMENAKNDTLKAIESISAASEETAATATELNVTVEEQLKGVEVLDEAVLKLNRNANKLEEIVLAFRT